jgi:hypothetical protein
MRLKRFLIFKTCAFLKNKGSVIHNLYYDAFKKLSYLKTYFLRNLTFVEKFFYLHFSVECVEELEKK